MNRCIYPAKSFIRATHTESGVKPHRVRRHIFRISQKRRPGIVEGKSVGVGMFRVGGGFLCWPPRTSSGQDHLVKGRTHESPITRSTAMKSCKYSTVPERRSLPHGGRNGGFSYNARDGMVVCNPGNTVQLRMSACVFPPAA